MMSYHFKDSKNENVSKTVLLALAGTTGSGKTESALRLARGIVGPTGKFCVIDTENRRALNKKGRYQFDHLDLKPPYSPDNFKGAIESAINAGYEAIIVDSMSHEWAGEGGCADMQEEILERLCKGDMSKAERLTALAWKEPKQKHKKLIYKILQSGVPIIFCLRAEPKIKFTKDPTNGKTQVVDAGWQPICEKMFGYEMLIYALLMPENPGVPVHLKELEPEFAPMFPLGKQITEEVGALIGKWARGEENKKPDYEKQIAGCTSISELSELWATIPPTDKVRLGAEKDAAKVRLSKECPECHQVGSHSMSCPNAAPEGD